MIRLLTHTPPPLSRQLDRREHRKTEKERQVADGRGRGGGKGVGEEPNHIPAESLLLYKSSILSAFDQYIFFVPKLKYSTTKQFLF